jgi:hypothetical protein
VTPTDAADAAIMHFIYDREDVILDFIDADGAGRPAAPTHAQRYLHGLAIDQVLGQGNAAGTVQWHLTDHLGTVRDLVDNSGAAANRIKYDSYENVDGRSGALVGTRYQFTGREADSETALLYHCVGTRQSYRRFTNEDPFGFTKQQTPTLLGENGQGASLEQGRADRKISMAEKWHQVSRRGMICTAEEI